MSFMPAGCDLTTETKKADVPEHLKVFDHVGLLVNEPPGTRPGCSLSSHPTISLERGSQLRRTLPPLQSYAPEREMQWGFFLPHLVSSLRVASSRLCGKEAIVT
jgi:hypothetical protein